MNKKTAQGIAKLQSIVDGIGTMSMEYWDGYDQRQAEEALSGLSNIAYQAERLRSRIGATEEETLVQALDRYISELLTP